MFKSGYFNEKTAVKTLCSGLLFFDEPQKVPELWAFLAKKENGNFLSKLPFFCGGGGENRTPVRKPLNQTFYERIR